MGRFKADSAERIIELSKTGISKQFVRQIIISEGFKHTSSTTVDNYYNNDVTNCSNKDQYVEVPLELWKMIFGYFSMQEELKSTAKSILDQIRCSE